jgi:mRNA-degrading endonuclease toxin of MazEF toxin-antitoxin module
MNQQFLEFDKGITNDRIFVHRGDIFITEGVFKDLNSETRDKDDHIIGKPTRPVLVISEDKYNQDVVKVLPFSSRAGSAEENRINSYRNIKVPGFGSDPTRPSYIDISQVFTINVYQLKVKLAHASQEIVDAAVALHTVMQMNANSVGTMLSVIKDKFPQAQAFRQMYSEKESKIIINNNRNPYDTVYTEVKQVTLEELENKKKYTIREYIDAEYAKQLYEEWKAFGTDLFRDKYGLSKQAYYAIRDKCVMQLLGKIAGFKKYDWS